MIAFFTGWVSGIATMCLLALWAALSVPKPRILPPPKHARIVGGEGR